MENHPIPQDITGFQFKLIGNMTVKQFIYLAAGTVMAWFIFFVLPIHFLIKFPLAITFLLFGVSLAFLPIDGRPMDIMIINLIKALFSPTQYIYKKTGGNLAEQLSTQPKPQPVITTSPVQPPISAPSVPAEQPIPVAQSIPVQMPQMANSAFSPQTQPLMTLEDDEKELENEVSALKKQLEEASKTLNTVPVAPAPQPIINQQGAELERMLTETTRQKEALEKELLTLRAKLDSEQQEKFSTGTATPIQQTQRVKKIPAGMEKAVGVPSISQDPNLVLGVVKDPRGNPLPNILVEVKDMDDNPVRAFKTNGLGQFASATSLSNGKYIMTFEDSAAQNKFDAVEIETTGAPLMPLEIISVDPREELRRELFK